MAESFLHKLQNRIQGAALFERAGMVQPEVILWLNPGSQWQSIIGELQKQMPQFLVFGNYDSANKTGPAILLKCMVAKVLPEANWSNRQTPVIYLPAIARQDLKKLTNARAVLIPLMEN